MKPKHDNGKPDTRYTVTPEHDGHAVPPMLHNWELCKPTKRSTRLPLWGYPRWSSWFCREC